MMRSDPLAPLAVDSFDRDHARHLLCRAAFGAPPATIQRFATQGLERSVMELVHFDQLPPDDSLPAMVSDPDIIRPLTVEERQEQARARREDDREALTRFEMMRNDARRRDRQQAAQLERWWLAHLARSPRPLEENLALLWHGHFTSSFRVIRDSHMLYQQHHLFRRHAPRFDLLLEAMLHDPALLRYLDNHRNVRGRPNENLARELLELFTLGEGNYSEHDIAETARALSGHGIDDHSFVLRPRLHDPGPKTILGQTEAFNARRLVPLLLSQPACRRHIAWKLYRHFVEDVPAVDTPESANTIIHAIAAELERWNFDLTPVLTRLFTSRAFYEAPTRSRMIRSPAHLVFGLARTLGSPNRDWQLIANQMGVMGQRLFDPPTVGGWDGGRTWINTSTLFARQNTAAYLIEGDPRMIGRRGRALPPADPQPLLGSERPATLTDALPLLLGAMLNSGPNLPANRLNALRAYCATRPQPTPAHLRRLMILITALPEFQLV